MPGTSNFGHFDHFSYWKSQFLSFCLSGVSENAILTLFWPILSPPEPNLWPLAKMCLFRPTALEGPWRTLRDPNLTLIFTILDPFWGSWREVAARPHYRAAFGLRTCSDPSQTHARDLKFWSFWPLFLLKKSIFVILPIRGQWKCHFDPILTHFEPSWA